MRDAAKSTIFACLPAAVAAIALLVAPAARANPWDFFSLGSRGAALGGAVSTLSTDGYAVFYNPAALTLGSAVTISIGFQGSVPLFDVDLTGGEALGPAADKVLATQEADEYAELTLSATLPFRRVFPGLGREITLGLAVGLPRAGAIVSRGTAPAPTDAFAPVLDGWNQRLMVMLGLGGEILPGRLSVGIGLLVLSHHGGTIHLRHPTGSDGSENAEVVEGGFQQAFDTAASVNAGLLWRPVNWLSIGFTFRDEQVIRAETDIQVDTFTDNGDRVRLPYTLRSDLFLIPREFLLGLSARVHPVVTLALDAAYVQTSRLSEVSPIATLTRRGGEGALDDAPAPVVSPKVDARDVFTVRTGIEIAAIPDILQVRAGYGFHPRVLDGDQQNLLIDADRHVISLGVGVKLGPAGDAGPAFLIEGHLQAILLGDGRHGVALPGADGTPVGTATAEITGATVGGGLTASFQF